MKRVLGVYDAADPHWIGDGFPVVSLFSYQRHGARVSPFLQLDYAGPHEFAPAATPRGIAAHPHRGIETVTFCVQGGFAHRDSAGQGGLLLPGDVQWMTAGAGLLHEELHSPAFTQRGGTLEALQLWINLPAALKWTAPAYQPIAGANIPCIEIPGGRLRLVAGDCDAVRAPARPRTPMAVWELVLEGGEPFEWRMPEGWSALLVALHGAAALADGTRLGARQTAIFEREGNVVRIAAAPRLHALLLSGEPIDEALAGRGPFVMNTPAELEQAFADAAAGRFGRMPD
ncbi:MAG: pirin family protein [Gammaproteobacteria bacterium]|nr:pirin family protein [Gammaproteobacteria bacterium]